MEDQLFYLYNNAKNFKLLIIDNSSNDEEKRKLEQLTSVYSCHDNIKIIYNTPKQNIIYKSQEDISQNIEVDQHGAALNIAKSQLDTKYVVFYDLDFFWLRKKILNYFESQFDRGYRTVGAPYPQKVGYGQSDFPALFGCAHYVEDIKDIDFTGEYVDLDKKNEALKLYPKENGYAFSLDVGYRVRMKLSDLKYKSFSQYPFVISAFKKFKDYCHLRSIVSYYDGYELIGTHLFGGSRQAEQTHYVLKLKPEELTQLNIAWIHSRKQYAAYLSNVCNKRIGKIHFTANRLASSCKNMLRKNPRLFNTLKKLK